MNDADTRRTNRKIYGRGFRDGLKKALEGGVGLSASRARALEQSLTGIQRKVYEVLSSQTPMSIGEVCGEMRRTTGSNPDFKIVGGCLGALVDNGLAREVSGNKFQRVVVRDRPAEVKLEVVSTTSADHRSVDAAAQAETPMEAIRRLHGEILERLGEVEKQAALIEAERTKANDRNEKATRLAELLKDFR